MSDKVSSSETLDPSGEFDLLPDRTDLLKHLLETPDVGIGLTDVDDVFVFANPAAERLFGVKPGDLLGRSLYDFLTPGWTKTIKAKNRQRMGGLQDSYDMPIDLDDGSRRWLMVNVTPRQDKDGRFLGTQGIFQDITGHYEAQEALKESEERYRQLIDAIPHGVGILQRRKIVFANEAAVRLLGYDSVEDIEGMDALRPLSEGQKDRVLSLVQGLLSGENKRPVHYTTEVLREGTPPLTVEVFITLVQHRGERAIQVFMMDISERQQAEAERIRLEERLIEAEKMQSVGRLAGGVAHDFNNLLTPILGYADMGLLRVPPEDPLHEDLKEIRDAAEKARLLVQQLLAFGGKQVMQIQTLNCNELLRDTAPMLRRVIRENIAVIQRSCPEPLLVNGDPGQLEQVLVHLALNARDAMPHGGELEIATRSVVLDDADLDTLPELSPGRYALVEIRDTGVGMETAEVARIFEPFYTTKKKGETAGLGLATVHGIVKQHRGHITVESRPGVGSIFSIYLPLREGSSPWPASTDAGSPKRITLEGKVALVVEDSGPVRRQVATFLKRKGMAVKTAANGTEALEFATREPGPIHLLITDVVMPGLNGKELCKRLKSTRPHLPTLYISGYTDDVIGQNGRIEEGITFLQKPFTLDALLLKIQTVLADG